MQAQQYEVPSRHRHPYPGADTFRNRTAKPHGLRTQSRRMCREFEWPDTEPRPNQEQ